VDNLLSVGYACCSLLQKEGDIQRGCPHSQVREIKRVSSHDKYLHDGLPEALEALNTPIVAFQQGQDGILRRSDVEGPASLLQCMSLHPSLLDPAICPIRRERDIDLLQRIMMNEAKRTSMLNGCAQGYLFDVIGVLKLYNQSRDLAEFDVADHFDPLHCLCFHIY